MMARAYSQDLRDRVIDAALGGLPARRAAAQFRIGLATAIRWVHRMRQTGDRTAGRQGQPRRSKWSPLSYHHTMGVNISLSSVLTPAALFISVQTCQESESILARFAEVTSVT